ncbi:MAG: zinc ribbon domain-containing protein [Leptospirales bacterium]|jgi:hypothetical protein|nr:zinc ribbon domain-containing protein [Leptospirales bacterium]HNE23870.1 zinc ribbon domain-containing protein [Leptospiraceae bacterium]HNL70395.1 zinc ribbon domain-containing protein [Leptospiraceae bacterium]
MENSEAFQEQSDSKKFSKHGARECAKCGWRGDSRFCQNCGTEIIEEFCTNCGAQLTTSFCTSCGVARETLQGGSTSFAGTEAFDSEQAIHSGEVERGSENAAQSAEDDAVAAFERACFEFGEQISGTWHWRYTTSLGTPMLCLLTIRVFGGEADADAFFLTIGDETQFPSNCVRRVFYDLTKGSPIQVVTEAISYCSPAGISTDVVGMVMLSDGYTAWENEKVGAANEYEYDDELDILQCTGAVYERMPRSRVTTIMQGLF